MVDEFDAKTEVIVNGSQRASCNMCFQGINEDTSSVRGLLFDCLEESRGTRALSYTFGLAISLFVVQVFVIVNCCMLLIYMHRQTFPTSSFSSSLLRFSSSSIADGETEWDTYVCDNRSFIFLLVFSSVHMAGNATKRMRKNRHWLWSVSIVILCLQWRGEKNF